MKRLLLVALAMTLLATPALAQRPRGGGGGQHMGGQVQHSQPAQPRQAAPRQSPAPRQNAPQAQPRQAGPRQTPPRYAEPRRGNDRGGRQITNGYRPYHYGPHGRVWFYGGRYWTGYANPLFYAFGPRVWFFDDGFWYPYTDIVINITANDNYAHVTFGPFPPDAEVFVDGKTHGLLSQITTLGITPGEHTITIHASDQEWQYTVNLGAGETITLRLPQD